MLTKYLTSQHFFIIHLCVLTLQDVNLLSRNILLMLLFLRGHQLSWNVVPLDLPHHQFLGLRMEFLYQVIKVGEEEFYLKETSTLCELCQISGEDLIVVLINVWLSIAMVQRAAKKQLCWLEVSDYIMMQLLISPTTVLIKNSVTLTLTQFDHLYVAILYNVITNNNQLCTISSSSAEESVPIETLQSNGISWRVSCYEMFSSKGLPCSYCFLVT